MKKDNMDELLQQYLDLSLQHSDKVALEKALETDGDARSDLEKYRKIMELLQVEEAMVPPADFTGRVMAALPDISEVARPEAVSGSSMSFATPFWLKPAFALAGLAVAAAAILVVLPEKQIEDAGVSRPALSAPSEIARENTPVKLPAAFQDTRSPLVAGALPALELTVESGVIRIKRHGGGVDTLRANQVARLDFMDEVETGVRSSASIIWPEDSVRLKLKPRTRIQVARSSIRLHHGDSWVNVVRKGVNFEVQTPNLVAAVRGTMFSASVRYSTQNLQHSVSETVQPGPLALDALDAVGQQLRKGLVFLADSQQLSVEDPLMRSSEVNVFEGVVNVAGLEDSMEESQNLFAGDAVASRGPGWVSPAEDVNPKVWLRWQSELEDAGIALSEEAEEAAESGVYTIEELEINHEILPENSFGQEFTE